MIQKLTTLLSILLILLIIIIYWPITKFFYQQDEWLGYGLFLSKGTDLIFESSKGFLSIILGEGRILTNFILFIFYKYFPLNVYPIAIFAIIAHLINSILVFKLSKKIFKNTLSSIAGTLFFIFNSLHLSAISWPAASINTLPSTTLILISLLSYFEYLSSNKSKWMYIAFAMIYLSLFFKESGIFLFALIPLSLFFYKKIEFTRLLKDFWYFFVPLVLIVLYRLYGLGSMNSEVALFSTGASKYFFDSILVRLVMYPITSFSLSLFNPIYMLDFARYITNVIYPFIPEAQFILVAQTVVLDLIAAILSFSLLILLIVLIKYENFKNEKKIFFWVLFLLASFLPYVIIGKSFSYLESRYYYLSSVAWSMIISWIFILINEKIKFNSLKIFLLGAYIMFICFNIKIINRDLKLEVAQAQTRIKILNQISKLTPNIDTKINVFYVTGDTDYYITNHKVPFQQGFGYTLLAYYFDNSQYSRDFLLNTKLFEIGAQGYYEKDNYGFGYFSNLEKMQIEVKKYKISESNIYKFYFDSKNEQISILK